MAACSCLSSSYEAAVSSNTRLEFRHLLLGFRGTSLRLLQHCCSSCIDCLKGSQQKLVAFGQIVRQRVGVIHVTNCCNNLFQARQDQLVKSQNQKYFQPTRRYRLRRRPVLRSRPPSNLTKLRILKLDAFVIVGGRQQSGTCRASSRLYQMQNPSRSQNRILIRSRLRLKNRNR